MTWWLDLGIDDSSLTVLLSSNRKKVQTALPNHNSLNRVQENLLEPHRVSTRKTYSSTGLYKYILIDLNEVSVQYIPFLKCKCMVPNFHFPQGFMSIPFKGQYCSRAKREQIRKLASIFRESRLPYWLEQMLNLRPFWMEF